ncbi:MAG: prolipoprotein diacylglyceryl transferase [Chlamydiae bacterium CG10_big_fil_rev_8_21_14_0_10_35_9]|nr:MAG: prolipoprotein diacylglyceryl transferase [Chlamydiae bacterium CG10_big_fil_rev_8_21_14_0_10_35_9]
MIGWIYWNPSRWLFTLPIVDIPIPIYGLLFASGFFLGYYIFSSLIKKLLKIFPEYSETDILSYEALRLELKSTTDNKFQLLQTLNEKLLSDPYQKRLEWDQKLTGIVLSLKKKIYFIADKALLYMVVATVVGARLGHFLFYENPAEYLQDPLEILKIWEGGLASHGAAIGIILAMVLLSQKMKKIFPQLNWIKLLDFVSIPAALGGCFIRVGNFFNQEILGRPTQMFWGVVFGSPMGATKGIIPRHPVQLYEAGFYLLTFIILWTVAKKKQFFLSNGKIFSLFLILVFSFRFLIEFFKEHQSMLLSSQPFINMGQYLSIPLIIAGFILFKTKKPLGNQPY